MAREMPGKSLRYIRADIAAKLMGMAEISLRMMRHRGQGPRYYRSRGRIYYTVPDIEQWQNNQLQPIDPAAKLRKKKP